MRTFFLLALLGAALPASAQRADPSAAIQYGDRDRLLLQQAQADYALRSQQELQRRLDRARENCNANRGVDCDTPQGLQEWLALERSRAEAVLDRMAVPPPASLPR